MLAVCVSYPMDIPLWQPWYQRSLGRVEIGEEKFNSCVDKLYNGLRIQEVISKYSLKISMMHQQIISRSLNIYEAFHVIPYGKKYTEKICITFLLFFPNDLKKKTQWINCFLWFIALKNFNQKACMISSQIFKVKPYWLFSVYLSSSIIMLVFPINTLFKH